MTHIADQDPWGPLARLLPAEALAEWSWEAEHSAADTGARVQRYRHAWSRRELALDRAVRVYDPTDLQRVRLLGDGGPAALLAALAAVLAGVPAPSPRRVQLPAAPAASTDAVPDVAGALARMEAQLWRACAGTEDRQGKPAVADEPSV